MRGIKKVNVIWKRGGQKLQDHMKNILEQSKLKEDDYAKDLDEKGNVMNTLLISDNICLLK